MAGEVQLPLVGSVSKRALAIGGAGAGVVMLILWYRKRSSSASTTPTDTSATDLSGIDTTGVDAGGGGSVPGGSTVTTPASNPQWTQLVMDQLSGIVDPSALASALGKYLAGAAVTTDETTIIDQAIAVAGWPPVSGPNGYPPAIRTQPSTGQTPPPPDNNPPPGNNPPPSNTPPAGRPTGGTTVIDGKHLDELLSWYHMSQAEFEALNPGIQSVYRWYQAGKGYAPGNVQRPGDIIALNVGLPRVVKVYTDHIG